MIEAEHFASQEIADRISDTADRIQRIQEKMKVNSHLFVKIYLLAVLIHFRKRMNLSSN